MIFATLEHMLTHIYFLIISIVIPTHLMILVYEIVGLCDSSEKGMIATFFYITGLLVTHWIYSGHVPLSDLYESLMFLSWSFSLIHIVPYFRNYMNFFSKITAPSAILTQGFATSGLLTKMHQSVILVSALQSRWLMTHVSMMLLSYAVLLCGSLLSITLRVITFGRKIDIFNKIKKFLITFITWAVFAIYLHTRTNKSLQGANSSIGASMGFIIIWICYFGVNLLGRGLHSYDSFTLNI
ncbi:unnamed protein product [Victoria cruziana]